MISFVWVLSLLLYHKPWVPCHTEAALASRKGTKCLWCQIHCPIWFHWINTIGSKLLLCTCEVKGCALWSLCGRSWGMLLPGQCSALSQQNAAHHCTGVLYRRSSLPSSIAKQKWWQLMLHAALSAVITFYAFLKSTCWMIYPLTGIIHKSDHFVPKRIWNSQVWQQNI